MTKQLSPAAIVALKEALCSIYWYKDQLRSFLQSCISDKNIVIRLDWNKYKIQIVSDLVDYLISEPDIYLDDLTRLCQEVSKFKTFKHLEQIEDGLEKAQRARIAVEELKKLLIPHQEIINEKEAIKERQKRASEKLRENAAVRMKLSQINKKYMDLISSTDPQKRGYELENLMHDLFELFDLDPKASFKNTGEQIDGAFSLEGTDYLFEAKWQQSFVGVKDLDAFSSKVQRKLDNTLGVFLSINGFSQDGITAHSKSRPSIILMDGADLMGVFEERIDFTSLLLRKKSHAAHTGNIFLQIHNIDL
ncbi:MAG: restriction endonuclease [Nitrospinaceae bacterium]